MLPTALLPAGTPAATPVHLVTAESFPALRAGLAQSAQAYLAAIGYEPKAGRLALLPGAAGGLAGAVFGIDASGDRFAPGKLASLLPPADFAFAALPAAPELAVLAFLLEGYRFDRYRKVDAPKARLVLPAGVDGARLGRIAAAIALGRDLINTPANDLSPARLAEAALTLAAEHGAETDIIAAGLLLERNFPLIHAVGRAAAEPPRLVDLTWGDASHPKVTLVGKGVCFDTGGLNLKPDNSMLLMKKDMGGAATALAAAAIIMGEALPVRLRVLLPIVENAVSAPSFRPGDIYRSRKGLSVEIGNTDAEGRLILADALAYADEEAPDLLIDYATLTGAARVALGPDLPPFYTESDALADAVQAAAAAVNDPVWRMPLWKPYDSMLDSKFADINNVSGGAFAGSITAALFLKRFVTNARAYAHFDIFGWTPAAKPGRPEGGEPQAARLTARLVAELAAGRTGALAG